MERNPIDFGEKVYELSYMACKCMAIAYSECELGSERHYAALRARDAYLDAAKQYTCAAGCRAHCNEWYAWVDRASTSERLAGQFCKKVW